MGTSALPYGHGIPFTCQAKEAIDNCRAGRAAEGATLGLTQSCSLRSVTLVAYLSALAYLAPKKRYQRFSSRAARPNLDGKRLLTIVRNPSTPKKTPPCGGVLVYPLGFEPKLDGVGGRNVIQLHYEYVFSFQAISIFYYFLLSFCKHLWYTISKL